MNKELIKEKFRNFFFGKDKYFNWALIAILILALILRIKYFAINSAEWWDATEALSVARRMAFNLEHVFNTQNPRRPFLLPLLWAGMLKLKDSEFFLRFSILIFSFIGVIATYLIGKEMFDKKVALIATFGIAVFWQHLFFTGRFLDIMPSATFAWLSFYFIWKGYVKEYDKKYIWMAGLAFGLAIFARAGSIFFIAPLMALFLMKKKLNFLKDKNLWAIPVIILLVLAPFIIWVSLNYNHPVTKMLGSEGGAGRTSRLVALGGYTLTGMWEYVKFLPGYLGSAFLILFLIGFALIILDLVLGFDMIFDEGEKVKKAIFLLAWIFVPLLVFGNEWITAKFIQPRYLLAAFPAVFLIIGDGAMRIYEFAKKQQKTAGLIVLGVILIGLLFGGVYQYDTAKQSINEKKDSYLQVKEAALWMKEHSNSSDVIISNSIPQTIYYSDRGVYMMGEPEEEGLLAKKPKFLVTSVYEKSQEWYYQYPEKHADMFKVVKVYDIGGNPSLVIYEFLKWDKN